MKRTIVGLLALLCFPAAAQGDVPARAAAVCADYPNQAAAQRAKDTRDSDGDGVYCETLPCPCLRPGQTPSTPREPQRRRTERWRAQIIDVTDGDTIKVRLRGGASRTIRLIGIDTPETKKPGVPIECGGLEATDHMFRLGFTAPQDTDVDGLADERGGQGRRVTVVTDPTQDRKDRYGRLLAYVTTLAGVDLARTQIARGWAKSYVYERAFQRLRTYRTAERRARDNAAGVWDPATCNGDFHSAQ